MAAIAQSIALLLFLSLAYLSHGGITSRFMRKLEASVDMPAEAFPPPSGHNAPEQVHITQGDRNGRGVIISWVTPLSPKPNVVRYWAADSDEDHDHTVRSRITTYKYYNYTSGFIHHATISDLEYDTKYFYEIGSGDAKRRFFFTTPPMVGPDVPYTFGIIGDLGQTYDSNQTFEHYYSNSKGQAVLFVGDLSYADNHPFHDNRKWDTWGRFVEKSTAYQPWIWTAGNHEMDFAPELGENTPFKPFTHRYHVPYKSAQSSSPLWYSIKRASASYSSSSSPFSRPPPLPLFSPPSSPPRRTLSTNPITVKFLVRPSAQAQSPPSRSRSREGCFAARLILIFVFRSVPPPQP